MSNKASQIILRRRQLDRLLRSWAVLPALDPPKCGWVRELRQALGMTEAHLAERLGVRQPTVAALEKSEAAGAVSLDRLRRAAEALDCRLVYALIPRSSLEETVARQADAAARRLVARTSHHMALEDQAGSEARLAAQVADLAAELARTGRRNLWEG